MKTFVTDFAIVLTAILMNFERETFPSHSIRTHYYKLCMKLF